MDEQGKRRYEFGPFRIDTEDRLLRRDEDVISLGPKAVETLMVLLESGGRVVEKRELMEQVWPDAFVEEGSLSRNVFLVRKALGENGDGSRYIETIPKRGYRFTAVVKEVRGENSDAELSRRGEPLTPIKSLAVLPLLNLPEDKDQEFFADGMTEELINYLARIEALLVISRTSVMTYKNTSKPLLQIARELQVDAVVEGSVFRSGDRVRITAQLIDARTEKHLWAGRYEDDLRDVLALQSKIATAICEEIQVKITPSEEASLAKSRPVDPATYQAYSWGRHFSNMRTVDALKQAVGYFQQAIQADPTYALAHAGLADTYALLASVGYDGMRPNEAMPLAKAAAHEALRMDDTLAEAHTSLGYIKLSYDWDWPGAAKEFKRSIELSPGYANARQWYSHYFMAMGQLDEAAREMRRALDSDPLSIPANLGVGWASYYARDYDRAIEQYNKTLDIAPGTPMVIYEIGLAYQNKKSYRKAFSEFQKAYKLSGGEPAAVMLLGHAHALLGRKAAACKELARLEKLSQRQYVPAVYTAFIYAGLNDRDRAFEWFEKAFEERSSYLIYLNVEPSLDNLRSDPRYQDLLRRVGLVQ